MWSLLPKCSIVDVVYPAPLKEPPSVVELAGTERSALALAGEAPLSRLVERRVSCSPLALHKPWQRLSPWKTAVADGAGAVSSPRESPRGVFSLRSPPEQAAAAWKGSSCGRHDLFPLFRGSAGFEEFCVVECTRDRCLSLSWSLRCYCGALQLNPGPCWLCLGLQNASIREL